MPDQVPQAADVVRSRYDEFVERFVAAARSCALATRPRVDSDTGPKVSEAELTKVHERVQAAVAAGAEVALGGGRPGGRRYAKGYWFAPTVLTGVSEEMDVLRSEVFGPVLPIPPIDPFEEALALANGPPYGLTAYAYTKDYDHAMRGPRGGRLRRDLRDQDRPRARPWVPHGLPELAMVGDDGPDGYERYLRRKTVYLSHD